MLCPSCHALNRENARFCKGCGQAVAVETVVPETAIDENDLSLAPTQILTPAQMMQYHSSRWQQEMHREQAQVGAHAVPNESPDNAGSQGQSQQELANAPTVYAQNLSASAEAAQNVGSVQDTEAAQGAGSAPTVYDLADTPTIIVAAKEVSAQSVRDATEAPPTEEQQSGGMGKQKGEEPEQATLFEEEKSMNQNQRSADADDTVVPKDEQTKQAFPVLPVGTTIGDRYEVTQVVKGEQDEHVYEVLDHKGYLYCWSCSSKDNAEGDEYCANCGAQLFEVTYLMHEYPAADAGAASQEASVLQAKIVDTILENGHTYAIEQPQAEQNVFPTGVRLLAACDSDAGDLRRSDPNEDSTLVLFLQRMHESLASPAGIFLVADGLGGHSNGQYASRTAISVIADRVVRDLFLAPLSAEKGGEALKQWDEEALLGLLQGAIEDANTAICQINQRDKTDMGCTLTGVMIAGDRAYIFNVGDSRTYILRDAKIYQLTKDHSLVGQLVEGGLIEPDDVYSHPQRSQIYRSIGDKLSIQIDLFKQQVHPGDILLSCSDGLWEMVRDPQIAEILDTAPDPQTACTQLIEAANANGGEDNVSAVVVFVR